MCGRFGLAATPEDIAELLEVEATEIDIDVPRFNITPGSKCLVVRHDRQRAKRAQGVTWGLIPSWANNPKIGQRLTNARSETVREKSAFKEAFRRRRCLVLTDGFYEWRRHQGERQPFHIGMPNNEVFCFGAVWERWHDSHGISHDTFAILTTTPNALMAPIHHRMPVIIDPSDYECWLDRDVPEHALVPMLRPCADDMLICWPVSTRVNSARHDDVGCRAPTTPPLRLL